MCLENKTQAVVCVQEKPQPGRICFCFLNLPIIYSWGDSVIVCAKFLFAVLITVCHSFTVLLASHAHSYLHRPGINGVSMSHEWAIIRDEVIYSWPGKAARHTENIPYQSVMDEETETWLERKISCERWPISLNQLKWLPLSSRQKKKHFSVYWLINGSCA